MRMLTPRDLQLLRELETLPINRFDRKNWGVAGIVEDGLTVAVNHGGPIDYFLDHPAAGLTPGVRGTGAHAIVGFLSRFGRQRTCLGALQELKLSAVMTRCGCSSTSWEIAIETLTDDNLDLVQSLQPARGDPDATDRVRRKIEHEGMASILCIYQSNRDWRIPGLLEWHTAHAFSPVFYERDHEARERFRACFDASVSEESVKDDFYTHFACVVFERALAETYSGYCSTAPLPDTLDERFAVMHEALMKWMHAGDK